MILAHYGDAAVADNLHERPVYPGIPARDVRAMARRELGMHSRTIYTGLVELERRGYIERTECRSAGMALDDVIKARAVPDYVPTAWRCWGF